MITLVTLAQTLALLAMPTPPPAAGRCGDGFSGAHEPRGFCQELAAAPRLAATDAYAGKALALWAGLVEPVLALTERGTGIVLLAPEARMRDGRELAPAAWICPGTPPVIYVPYTLLQKVYGPDGRGESLLAFVLAHELGHRVNDFTIDGCPAAFGDATSDVERERRADFRGVFFAAVAGFDATALIQSGIVAGFLKNDLNVGIVDLDARHDSMAEASGWFPVLEDRYQAALALTLVGERGAAARLLDGIAEDLADRAIPLPEVTLAHALALLSDAAAAAPWLGAIDRLPAPLEPLACRPVHPSHGAYAEEPSAGRVRADPLAREAARRSLERARRLADQAADLGAAPLAVASAKSCIALYLGDPALATSLAESAKKMAFAQRAVPAVVQALDASAALARFAAFLEAHPAVAEGDAQRAQWLVELAAARPGFVPHAALDRYVAHLVGLPATPPLAGAPKCTAPPPTPPPPLPPVPAALIKTCGRGMPRDSSESLSVCRNGETSIFSANLPPLADPPLPKLDITLRLLEQPPRALRAFDAWVCTCDHLTPRGVSDLGENAWLGACPRLGMPLGLLHVDQRGRVRRVAIVD